MKTVKEFFKYLKVYFRKDTWRFKSEEKHDLYLVMLICMGMTMFLWLLTIGLMVN